MNTQTVNKTSRRNGQSGNAKSGNPKSGNAKGNQPQPAKQKVKRDTVPLSTFTQKPPLGPGQVTMQLPSAVTSPKIQAPVVKPKLLLLRGAPGSGKTTLAQTMFSKWTLICADEYFVQPDGNFEFNVSLLKEAHDDCVERTQLALSEGKNVVVHNTFRTLKELSRYHDFVAITDVRIYRVVSQFKSDHKTPQFTMNKHFKGYEPCSIEHEVKLDLENKKIIFCSDVGYQSPLFSFKGTVHQMREGKLKVGYSWYNVDPAVKVSELCGVGDYVNVTYYQFIGGMNVVCDVSPAEFT